MALSDGPTTWEYLVLHLVDLSHEARAASLNEAGRKHWELVAVLDGAAYLKRPIEHKREQTPARQISDKEWSRLQIEELRRETERRFPSY
jgi:hypothetical protein